MFLQNYSQFIDEIYQRLTNLGINRNDIEIDHLGYQASSADDYSEKIESIKDAAIQVSENIVGGRRVGVFKLNSQLNYKDISIKVVEIFEPREGEQVESHWEHIEFLVNGTLEEFIQRYPEVNWDISAKDREEFPMLILSLGDGLRAKFPRRGVLEEVERQKALA